MQTLAAGVSYLDLEFLGRPRVIASAVLHSKGSVAIVDPGPSTTLPVLRGALERAGISLSEVGAVLLTHIHLDHAGATGTLVAENPAIRVLVHENGARHLVDPSKLVASASRLYGDRMERLWGEVRAVPAAAIDVLAGGETLRLAGRQLSVAYTPGHASHHVSYFDPDSGIAFVGDTAGVKLQPTGYALPPTPPPDIDVETWRSSLLAIGAWRPDTLFLTHFGPYGSAQAHLEEVSGHLGTVAGIAQRALAEVTDADGEDKDALREKWFGEELGRELRRHMSEADAQAYGVAAPFPLNWRGLARYWRKKDATR